MPYLGKDLLVSMIDIQTQKFTENTLSLRWFFPLERKTVTALNLLTLMLSARSEKYPSRQAISTAASHAYGLHSGYGLFGYGNKVLVEYRISWIREELIDEEGYANEVLCMMDENLNHPLFSEEYMQEAKYLLQQRLLSLSQDPDTRALQEALKAAGKDKGLGIQIYGYLEDLPAITLEEVEALYQQLHNTENQTLVAGSLCAPIQSYVEKNWPGKPVEASWQAFQPQEPVSIHLEKEISQSSLAQVYTTGILPQDPRSFALIVLNALLGSSSVSLLFEIIREQHSYCYSISSSLIRFDGLLLIQTATDSSHMDDVKRLIAEILSDVAQKKISDDTFDMVKKEVCSNMAGQKDSAISLLEQAFLNEILHRPLSNAEMIEKIQAVTKDDVAAIAGDLHLISSAELVQKEAEDTEEADELNDRPERSDEAAASENESSAKTAGKGEEK